MQKCYMVKGETLTKKWYLMDADKQTLGKMAVEIATILMGKHRPWYTPHIDTGDFVVIINAEKFKVTGKKREDKKYYSWSGYPGGLKVKTMDDILETRPERIIRAAVRRMLPKTKLGRQMLKKLKIYVGENHPHEAQNPQVWKKDQKVTLKEVLVNE